MTTIAGASRYMNTAALANAKGSPAVSPTLLGQPGSAVDILDVGRRNSSIGLSARARELTKSYLNATGSAFNQIHSLATSANGTVFAMQQTIMALRASLPNSQISEYAVGFDETANTDPTLSATAGSIVDEEA